MAINEAIRTCELLTALLESKIKMNICESRKDARCSRRLKLELERLEEFKSELNLLSGRLTALFRLDRQGVRPLMLMQAAKALDCINAFDTFYQIRFKDYMKQGCCDNYFLVLSKEISDILRGYKRFLCAFIFNDTPGQGDSLLHYLSPKTGLEDLLKRVEVIVVEPGDLPPGAEKSKKMRIELLLESGFFAYEEIRFRSKKEKLDLAAEIVGCSLRHVQSALDELKKEGRKLPFPRGGRLGFMDSFREPSEN